MLPPDVRFNALTSCTKIDFHWLPRQTTLEWGKLTLLPRPHSWMDLRVYF